MNWLNGETNASFSFSEKDVQMMFLLDFVVRAGKLIPYVPFKLKGMLLMC